MTLRTRIILALVAVSTIPLLLIALFFLGYTERLLTKNALNLLEATAASKVNAINDLVEHNFSASALIASRTQLRANLDEYTRVHGVEERVGIKKILEDVKKASDQIISVSIVDLKGIAVASTDGAMEGNNVSDQPFFSVGIKGRYIDALQDDKGVPHILVAEPLFLDARKIGVLVLKVSYDPLLRIINDYKGLGESGETVFIKRTDEGVTYIAPTKSEPNAAFTKKVPNSFLENTAIQAFFQGQTSAFNIIDSRGTDVFIAGKYFDTLKWAITVRMLKSEVLAPVQQLRIMVFSMGIFLIILSVVIGLILASVITRPVHELTRVTNEITMGRLNISLNPKILSRKDEIGTLARSFDRILVSLKLAMRNNPTDHEAGAEKR